MRTYIFTNCHIITILKDANVDLLLKTVLCQQGVSHLYFVKWNAKYSGIDVSALRRLMETGLENRRPRLMYSYLGLYHLVFMGIVEKPL